jgi:hypothetical protein
MFATESSKSDLIEKSHRLDARHQRSLDESQELGLGEDRQARYGCGAI